MCSFPAIKLGLKDLLKAVNKQLTKNKTAELYLINRDGGDTNLLLEVTIPVLLCKYSYLLVHVVNTTKRGSTLLGF